MALTRLQVENVRNLRGVRLQDLGRVNVFFGSNGSGKTSLLESIYLLGMARSFRGSSIRTLIAHGEADCTVHGTAALPRSGAGLTLGVRRSRDGDVQIRVGGNTVRSAAELATQLPLQIITADSFGLLTGTPGERRRYLDWGVFHVEQRFFRDWQRFQRCIKQRNMLLRRGKIEDRELAVWTRDMERAGSAITAYRKAYFEQLVPLFKATMARLAPSLGALELHFRQGWSGELGYAEALEQGLPADREQGYTHAGPQRADIRVTSDGHLAADTLSRGQQKLVVCGLKIAQGQLMAGLGLGGCTYLIDDLPSELDEAHGRLVCDLLATMEAQVFITCVEAHEVRSVWPADTEAPAVFHVEHGAVERVRED